MTSRARAQSGFTLIELLVVVVLAVVALVGWRSFGDSGAQVSAKAADVRKNRKDGVN